MSWTNIGPVAFRGRRDSEGHREFLITYLMVTDSNQEGPASLMLSANLPQVGTQYTFGSLGQETDQYAWCRPDMDIEPAGEHRQGDFPYQQLVTVTFSTKPRANDKERPYQGGGSQGPDVANPLQEPPKISGSFVNFTEQASKDRFDRYIKNSAHERILSQQNEWDAGRDQIIFERNVASIDLQLIGALKHTVNSIPMWGMPKRSIKFSQHQWNRRFAGQGVAYISQVMTFDIAVVFDDKNSGILAKPNSTTSLTMLGLGAFSQTSDYVGRFITGYGIPLNTTITAATFNPNLSPPTTTLTLSSPATKTLTDYVNYVITPKPGLSSPLLRGGWDRDLIDEATKALRGHWNRDGSEPRFWQLEGSPNLLDPQDFKHTADTDGNFTHVILNGAGLPYNTLTDYAPGNVHIEKFYEADLVQLLGLPAFI